VLPLEWKVQLFHQVGYDPYPEQLEVHASTARVLLIAGGERAGKSRITAMELLTYAIAPEKESRIVIAGQKYEQTIPEANYVIEGLHKLGILDEKKLSQPKGAKWVIPSTTGCVYETVSLKESGKELTMRGLAYNCVAIVEAGTVVYQAFTNARGRVGETRGRVILSGTLWDEFGWYAQLFERLKGPNEYEGEAFSIPSWCNTKIYPGGRDDPEIKALEAAYGDAEFMRLIGAAIIPGPDVIYPEYRPSVHIAELDYDADQAVHLSIDPGYRPSRYAVLAIQPGVTEMGEPTINVIDDIWVNDLTHQEVIARCKERWWWPNVTGVWGGHETVQHNAQLSTAEVWRRETSLPFHTVRKPGFKVNLFMRVRTFLKDPVTGDSRLFIDKRCQGLPYEFPRYKRKTNFRHEVVSDDPPPNAEDDALDALTNYLVGRLGRVDRVPRRTAPGRRDIPARG